VFGALVAHRADQARAPLALEREDREKVGFVEIDVQLAVDRRPGRLDVGDIEDPGVVAAGKAGAFRA